MVNSGPDTRADPPRRLFLGVEMPAFIQARLAKLQADLPGARWQWPEDMHLTLRFLGSLTEEQQAHIRQAMQGLDVLPFDIGIRGVGSFSAKVFWAAVQANPQLHLLKHRIDQRLARIGIPAEDREFVPHVTLARTPESQASVAQSFLAKHHALELAPWTVRQLTLFRSKPGTSGPVYRVVERYSLTEGKA